MQENQTKNKLKAGETVFGCFVRYTDASLVEFLTWMGFDFLVFDAEHGAVDSHHCQEMVRAAELRGVTPIIRATTNQRHIILRYLDTGAQGVHVPMIDSAQDAEAAVRAIKYQPRGERGLAFARAADFGQGLPIDQYAKFANEQTLCVAQIETVAAVDALPEIVKVDGVDVIFVGPTDLSNSLGVPGQMQHPKMLKTLDRIVRIVAGSDKALATMVANAEAARQWVKRGAQYITVGCESMLKQGCAAYLESARGA